VTPLFIYDCLLGDVLLLVFFFFFDWHSILYAGEVFYTLLHEFFSFALVWLDTCMICVYNW
jgi:hypothetical protein